MRNNARKPAVFVETYHIAITSKLASSTNVTDLYHSTGCAQTLGRRLFCFWNVATGENSLDTLSWVYFFPRMIPSVCLVALKAFSMSAMIPDFRSQGGFLTRSAAGQWKMADVLASENRLGGFISWVGRNLTTSFRTASLGELQGTHGSTSLWWLHLGCEASWTPK